ncbi:ABC transporter permease [Acuticoccus sp. 2012]|uniref:ABC transporter permease n=1 Tax=Acuticoccus mangrovi TaxID=2796142 RepID=A0A934MEG7_9HYPH|nr:ABC transporter permease [Acuticoccus mangrovi]
MGAALGQRVVVLLIVAVAVFALLEVAKGDAVDAYLAQTGGGDAGYAETLRQSFGLAGTVPDRLFTYLGRLVRLDLGTSVAFGRPVTQVLAERLPITLILMGSALLITSVVGTILGIVASRRPGGVVDTLVITVALVLNATPGFLVALVGLLVFAVMLRWLPVGGIGTIGRAEGSPALDMVRHLVLPVSTLALTYLALYVRVTRAAMIEMAGADMVRTARAKGLGGRRLLLRHELRPALMPIVTLIGVQGSAMLGGSVVVETVFAVPGYGSLAAMAVAQRDTLLLAGVVLSGAVLVVAVNALVDILYGVIDPRVRLAGAAGRG